MYFKATTITIIFRKHQTCLPHKSKQCATGNPSGEEKTIYILQTIKVDQQQYSLLYDSGCCEMVSKYDAVRRIGHRATEEVAGPISIGEVGN